MLVPVLNGILFMFLFFMHIASRISNCFYVIVFKYNYYYIICENLPYIGRCKLVSATVVFYN